MRVYQVNVVCGSGSTGRIAADLAHTIQEHGGESRIAYGRGDAPEGVDAIKVSNKLDLYLHAMLTRITDKHGLYSRGATKRLIKDIRVYNPDIIHLHNIHGYYVNYEMLFRFLKEYNKPIVWTLHDCWTFTGHCAHFDYIKCNRWKEGCFACPQKGTYPKSNFLDNSRRNYQRKKESFTFPEKMTIVTVSDWLKDVTEQGFLKKYPIIKISNGINLDIMRPTEGNIREQYGLKDKKILLGVASVWSERKGIYTFYELAKHLPEQYKIVLIGLSEQQMKEKPKEIIGIRNVSDPGKLAEWYTAADIYVNTSVEETMGLTTVEAMACGTPVIVMDATANPELVKDKCGKIIKPKDIPGLIKGIQSIHKNEEVTECCQKHAGDYEKGKQYKKYLQLYGQMMSNMER